MKISEELPKIGSFVGGAIATGLAMRPGFNGRAIIVLAAGGLVGTVVVDSSLKISESIKRVLEEQVGYTSKSDSNIYRSFLVSLIFISMPWSVACAGAALSTRAGFPISYKTAAFVATFSYIGYQMGIQAYFNHASGMSSEFDIIKVKMSPK